MVGENGSGQSGKYKNTKEAVRESGENNNIEQTMQVKGGNRCKAKTKMIEMLPLYFLASIYPLIVSLKLYPSPFSGYVWERSGMLQMDFYGYGKSRVLIVTAFLCLVLLLLRWITDIPFQPMDRGFYLSAGFLICAVLSACLSDNKLLSVGVGNETYETIPVLLSYGVLLFYIVQVITHKEQIVSVCRALAVGSFFSAVLGILQALGISLMEKDWVQRILLGRYYAEYRGEIYYTYPYRASAALSNPDIAGAYFSMLLPVIVLCIACARAKWQKVCMVFVCLLTAAAMLLTRYRGIFLALFGALLLMLPILWKCIRQNRGMRICFGLAVVFLVAGVWGVFGNTGLFSRIRDEKPKLTLTDIQIEGDSLYLYREQEVLEICLKEDSYRIAADQGDGQQEDITQLYDAMEEQVQYPGFEELLVSIYVGDAEYADEPSTVTIVDHGCVWNFIQTKQGLEYQNQIGRTDSLLTADAALKQEWDYIGSGRLYIWSRTIPLLKRYLLFGSGACTYATVFPQNDYVAKAKAFGFNNLVITRADNSWLSVWVEHGLPGFLFLLLFGAWFLSKTYLHMREEGSPGVSGYLMTSVWIALFNGLFQCSSVYVTPVFLLLSGMLLAMYKRL